MNLRDCVVYGVEVPNHEGRAGMAAILDPDRSLDLNQMLKVAAKSLASYALPVFIRIVDTIEVITAICLMTMLITNALIKATGTYKLPKTALQREGFNLDLASVKRDPLFILDSRSSCYKKFDNNVYRDLIAGTHML